MLRVLADEEARAELRSTLDDLVLEGARRMLAAALEAEVDAYVTALAEERDAHGHRLVVRNGHAEPRTITTAAGGVEVGAPRVDDLRVNEATGQPHLLRKAIVSPWARRSPKVGEDLPVDVPARRVQRRLRTRAGRLLRIRGRPVSPSACSSPG